MLVTAGVPIPVRARACCHFWSLSFPSPSPGLSQSFSSLPPWVSEQDKYCALEESWRGSREGGREADGPAGSSEQGSQPCLPSGLPWCAQPQPGCSRIWSQHTSSQHVMASFLKQQFPLFLFGVYCFVIWGTGIHDRIGNVVSISLWRSGMVFFLSYWSEPEHIFPWTAQGLHSSPVTHTLRQWCSTHCLHCWKTIPFSLKRAVKRWLGLNQANSPLIAKWVSKRRRLPECWWFTFSHLMHQE